MKKRGAFGWLMGQGRDFRGSTQKGENPLVVHAVQDQSNLSNYLPRVRQFHSWVRYHSRPFGRDYQQDWALADFLAVKCYHEDVLPHWGKGCVAAFLHLYPDMSGKMPYTARALQTWTKLYLVLEREPIVEELVFCLVGDALLRGDFWTALGFSLHYDGYLRG
jgi:hypothetical protein